MAYKFSNRASSLIVVAVTTASSTITLEAGGGSKLPILSTGDFVQGTLIAATGVTEVVQVNSVVGDVVNVLRGQEGTSVTSFPVGSRFEVRLTARVLDNFLQRTGGTMLGDINMNNNTLTNYRQPQAVLIDEIHTRVIRNPAVPLSVPGQSGERFINFPTAGTQQPQITGWPIASLEFLRGMVFDWFGDINNLPAWLVLCNGQNGTPDLRGRFIKCYNDDITKGPIETTLFSGGGQVAVNTSENGNHDHGGSTVAAALTKSNVPGHLVSTSTGLPVQIKEDGQALRLLSVAVEHDNATPEHIHGIRFSGNHQHSVQTQPPYLIMYKVMFRPPPFTF